MVATGFFAAKYFTDLLLYRSDVLYSIFAKQKRFFVLAKDGIANSGANLGRFGPKRKVLDVSTKEAKPSFCFRFHRIGLGQNSRNLQCAVS